MVNKYLFDHDWSSVNVALAEIKKLQTDRSYRSKRGAFFVEGVRNFVKVADNNFDIVAIIYSERLLTAPLARKLVRQRRRAGVATLRVSPETFRAFSTTERASGISAVVRQRWYSLRKTSPAFGMCWVALGHVRSLGNFGTLIRTSEAIGGAGFILLDHRVDPYAPSVVRASMGAVYNQKFVRTNHGRLERWIDLHECQLVGASPDGAFDFHGYQFRRSTVLLLGEERQGLTSSERNLCHQLVRIPMTGTADSLNLGVAGSLLLYEVFRSSKSR